MNEDCATALETHMGSVTDQRAISASLVKSSQIKYIYMNTYTFYGVQKYQIDIDQKDHASYTLMQFLM